MIQSYLTTNDDKNKDKIKYFYTENNKNNTENDIVYELYNKNEIKSELLQKGNEEVVKYIVEHGADINKNNLKFFF